MNHRNFEIALQTLLAKQPEMLISNHHEKFRNRIIKELPPILFGAGRLGLTVLRGLREAGVEPIAFADNNPELWGSRIQGVEVLSLLEARQRSSHGAFVISIYTAKPVRQQLREKGVQEISFPELAWLFPEQFLPHGALDAPYEIFRQAGEIMRAAELWADEISRREYLGQIAWRLTLDDSKLPPYLPQNEIYFPDMVRPSAEEAFVDCGAFDGDSIREFIKRYVKYNSIVAIEPDRMNFQQLQAFVTSLPREQADKISCFNNAVGRERGQVQFNETGSAASSVGNGSYLVECTTLDELLGECKATFIKMDIEGAESDALKGAKKTIQTHTPILAICLYHSQDHLWQIPLLLRSFSDRYQFFLRRYSDHCWESVCYAVPHERLK